MGDVSRPLHLHTAAELALCRNKSDAAYLALRHSGLDQERIADRIPMDAGHLSRMIRGNRPWNDSAQERFERITGSLALTQYDCKARGGVFWVDEVESRRAQLQAQLRDLEQLRAA